MRIRSTTTTRMSVRASRGLLVVTAAVMAIAVPLAYVSRAYADQYDNQLNALQSQASQFQSQADQLRSQGDTLQNKLNQINNQKAGIETQISISQTKHDQLVAQIADNQKKMESAQSALGDMLASLYVDGKISALEMLASSQNIGDYVDKQEYRSSVRDQLNQSIDTIKKLKQQLENDKKALDKVLADLTVQQNQLAAAEAEQQSLVDQTRGEEAAYQQLVNSTRSQMSDVAAQQRAYYQSLLKRGGGGDSGVVGSFQYSNWSGNMGCSGGYAYCGAQDSYADPWGLYNRECVSYVAWALSARFHKYVGNFNGGGNAMNWPSTAPAYSGAVRVYSPQPGDAVILPATPGFSPIGHAMIVESVSGDTIHVSQYNFYGTGEYSTMDIKNSGIILLRFHS
jgi:peptidoglycan hydrolase CwlO-like protein